MHLIDLSKPDIIFLSEPQIFFSDLKYCSAYFQEHYKCELNSEDKYDSEIAMTKSRAMGGTMIFWKRTIDKYVSAIPVQSTSFLPLLYKPPGCQVSVHIALYLPTSGKENDFLDQLAQLTACIEELRETYEDCPIYIRGDGNVNPNNQERAKLFSTFVSNFELHQVPMPDQHRTYHHFLGGGTF